MKGSLQFEGVSAGSDGYSSGFGVIAQPDISLTALAPGEDAWVIVASDGLFANVERGGGGGLSNEEVAGIVVKVAGSGAAAVGAALTAAAQAAGSTDDVTVVALRLVV
jgi:protein phosphatase 1L